MNNFKKFDQFVNEINVFQDTSTESNTIQNDDENLYEGKFQDVENVGHGVKYRNEIFPGINSPKRYEGKGKYKWRVLAREGDKVKIINFGKKEDIKREGMTKLSKKYWENFWR